MKAVARQFARGKKCLCLRNGFFNDEEFVLKVYALSKR